MLKSMEFRWVTIFLDFPGDAFEAGTAFWREVTGCGVSPSRGAAGEFATLLPADGDAYLRVQRVFEGGGGCHLDLHVDLASWSLEEAAAGAVALGARMHDREDDEVIILDSPGGFTFCVVPWNGETAVPDPFAPSAPSAPSAPFVANGADASRVAQLTLDVPPAGCEREISFWAALTGWDPRPGPDPHYTFLACPAGLPAGLLFQRRETATPGNAAAGDRIRGHLDLECADMRRTADWHAGLGARVTRAYPWGIVLADPVGRPYCCLAAQTGFPP
jgi:hypothetical protein